MHKNFRLFTPVVLLLMGLSIALTGMIFAADRWLFIIGALVTSGVFAVVIWLLRRANTQIGKTLFELGESIDYTNTDAFADTKVPTLTVYQGGELIWYNEAADNLVFHGKSQLGEHISNLFPTLDFTKASGEKGENISYNNEKYTAYVTIGQRHDREISVIYLFEDTKLKNVYEEYQRTRPSVALVQVDSYEELLQDYRDVERAQIMSEIEDLVNAYFTARYGFVIRTERDKFIVILEEQGVQEIIQNKFDLLDQVRNTELADRMPVTLSIGLGRPSEGGLEESEDMARQALEMCLGRGGDQAAIRTPGGYEFFGGVSTGVEKRTKVKTRIIASALAELIEKSSNVVIMGHRFADLDALGSGVGLMKAARELNNNVVICMDREKNMAQQLLEHLEEAGYSDQDIRNPEEVLRTVNRNTLLIIVDAHVSGVLESQEIYELVRNVVVIDHHRKLVEYIKDAVIFYHEPHASSASEMVTELIQYFPKPPNITKVEAEALLAGITLDTKNFVMRTGVRTFEAAAWLRRMGADTVEVRRMFASSMESYQNKSAIVAKANVYKNCALAVVDKQFEGIRVASSQAADDLMNISGVNASFVVFPVEDVINVSARSLGAVNVQVIMEDLGGGGHLTMAAAQFPGETLEGVTAKVKEAIDRFYEGLSEERRTELNLLSETLPLLGDIPDEGTILEGQALEDIKTANME